MLVADEYLGGSGVFLVRLQQPAAAGHSGRPPCRPRGSDDLVAVARLFADVEEARHDARLVRQAVRGGLPPDVRRGRRDEMRRGPRAADRDRRVREAAQAVAVPHRRRRARRARSRSSSGPRGSTSASTSSRPSTTRSIATRRPSGAAAGRRRPRRSSSPRAEWIDKAGARLPGHAGPDEEVRHRQHHDELPGRVRQRATAGLSVPGLHADPRRRRPGRVRGHARRLGQHAHGPHPDGPGRATSPTRRSTRRRTRSSTPTAWRTPRSSARRARRTSSASARCTTATRAAAAPSRSCPKAT